MVVNSRHSWYNFSKYDCSFLLQSSSLRRTDHKGQHLREKAAGFKEIQTKGGLGAFSAPGPFLIPDKTKIARRPWKI